MEISQAQMRMGSLGIGYWLTLSAEGSDINSEAILGRKVSGANFLLVPARGTPLAIIGRMEADAVPKEFKRIIVSSQNDVQAVLRKSVPKGAKVALNFSKSPSCDYVTKTQFSFAKKALSGRKLVSSEKIQEVRAIRTKGELKDHRKAIDITRRALAVEAEKGFFGRSEEEIASSVRKSFFEQGSSEAFETIVASGPNSANPHHSPKGRRVRKEEPLLIDFGARVKSSCADITRTFWVGKRPSRFFSQVYSSVLFCQEASIGEISAGKIGSEINNFSIGLLKGNNSESAILHSLGHSLGLLVHEAGPGLSSREARALLAGQIVTVEPGLYFPGKFGVRIEDDILVKTGGRENLSRMVPKNNYKS